MTNKQTTNTKIAITDNEYALADKAALFFSQTVENAIAKRGACYVALSGGSTPALLYARLRQKDFAQSILWNKIHFFVSDERCVPLESNESNFGNANKQLFIPLKIDQSQLHPVLNPEKDPAAAALAYEKSICQYVSPGTNNLPAFDLIFLGLGPDGHTASLFPETKALSEQKRLVIDNYVSKLDANRITFTFSLINNANNIVFLACGENKAQVLAEIFSGTSNYPAAKVTPIHGSLTWFIDGTAAKNIT